MSDPNLLPTPDTPELPDDDAPEREPFLKRIRLKNFLSFGPDSGWIDLKPLNVLIGPNGAGKSNFIEAINVLRNTPGDLSRATGPGGRASHYPWKGPDAGSLLRIDAVFHDDIGGADLGYSLRLNASSDQFGVVGETLTLQTPVTVGHELRTDEYPLIVYDAAAPDRSAMYARKYESKPDRDFVKLGAVNPGQSLLSQRRDPSLYPEAFFLSAQLFSTPLFRLSDLDSRFSLRQPQSTDVPAGNFLNEYATNLAKTLNNIAVYEGVTESINDYLREILPGFRRFLPYAGTNSFELQFYEDGVQGPIPAARLSDGTLRYLVLLTILLHPTPPRLICIEEPEIGLHPDVIYGVGKLLIEASKRTQLIVTTHSDVLINALSGVPESVLVCEKEDGITKLKRLRLAELDDWLADYSLGDLWRQGHLGGNRW